MLSPDRAAGCVDASPSVEDVVDAALPRSEHGVAAAGRGSGVIQDRPALGRLAQRAALSGGRAGVEVSDVSVW